MHPVEKLSIAVQDMYGKNRAWCHYLGAIHSVATLEIEPSAERDALADHIKQMHDQIRRICGEYDKLRSMTGAMELKSNCKPRFYVDDSAGETCKGFCPVLRQKE